MKNITQGRSNQTKNTHATNAHTRFFEIHVRGQLDESWSDWLEDLDMELLDNGEMILSGHIGDQAALMGILNKMYRLNLALLSVNEVDAKQYHQG